MFLTSEQRHTAANQTKPNCASMLMSDHENDRIDDSAIFSTVASERQRDEFRRTPALQADRSGIAAAATRDNCPICKAADG